MLNSIFIETNQLDFRFFYEKIKFFGNDRVIPIEIFPTNVGELVLQKTAR